VSVLAQLERLDHRLVGRPEAEYVSESRKWRLRLAVVTLLTLLSLLIALAGDMGLVAWLLVAFAVATGVKTFLARSAWRRTARRPLLRGRVGLFVAPP
jgi:predicted lysophospholipase L1 biosynthesis ABC-type transport system permease subunit